VLAPQDVAEGVALVQLAFHLADKWRNPVLIYGDYLLAHTQESIAVERIEFAETLPPKAWALDGSTSGSGRSKSVTPLGVAKHGQPAMGQEGKAQYAATKIPYMEREVRSETGWLDDAETVIVAFGSPAKFVKYAIKQLRAAGHRIGFVRPITLWPFPYEAVAAAARGPHVQRVGSFELCAGQMIDDVRIGVAGAAPVHFIGGVSTDGSGFGVGRILDVEQVTARVLALHEGEAQPTVPGYEMFGYEIQPHQMEPTR
jgi:2-oxoglutarate/2-oxoacid ferredoxin oxidoreductase subunit alpha